MEDAPVETRAHDLRARVLEGKRPELMILEGPSGSRAPSPAEAESSCCLCVLAPVPRHQAGMATNRARDLEGQSSSLLNLQLFQSSRVGRHTALSERGSSPSPFKEQQPGFPAKLTARPRLAAVAVHLAAAAQMSAGHRCLFSGSISYSPERRS